MDSGTGSTILFFDDWYLQRRENLIRRIGRPNLISEGIFVDPDLDASWGYPTVFQDTASGQWRCLYEGQIHRESSKPGRKVAHVAVAIESSDGVRWEIPDLKDKVMIPDRIRPHQVLPLESFGEWGPCFYDSHTNNAQERLKAFVVSYDHDKGVFPSLDHAGTTTPHSPLYVSSDGLSWKLLEGASWHPSGIDPSVSAFWNPITESYVLAARPNFGDRRISVYETRDWRNFSEPEVAIRTDAQDPPASETYGMPIFPYGDIFVGLLWIYSPKRSRYGKVHCQLAYSYNGKHFQRALREQFLPSAAPGDFGYGCIYPSSMVVTEDHKIRIYSSASKGEHAQLIGRPDLGEGAILLHELRLDGFSYFEPPGGPGSFTTRVFYFHGEKLSLNVQAPNGEVRVQITENDGQPCEGYTFEDCLPFKGDDLFWEPKWRNGATVSAFSGKAVRLEVQLYNGRIYAIRGDFDVIHAGEYKQLTEHGNRPKPIYER